MVPLLVSGLVGKGLYDPSAKPKVRSRVAKFSVYVDDDIAMRSCSAVLWKERILCPSTVKLFLASPSQV